MCCKTPDTSWLPGIHGLKHFPYSSDVKRYVCFYYFTCVFFKSGLAGCLSLDSFYFWGPNLWRLFTQVFSYVANRVAQRRLVLLEEEEDYLSRSDCPHTGTYRHIIAWTVTSDCPHTGTSLHGLWCLTVHIWTRHCMEIMAEGAVIIIHFVNTKSHLLAEISSSICISKFQTILRVSFFWLDSGLCIYHLVAWTYRVSQYTWDPCDY